MSDSHPPNSAQRIEQLRTAINEIEASSDNLKPLLRPAAAHQETPDPKVAQRARLSSDWMHRIPARYHHGHNGFDRRLMEDLAAVGVRCYTVQDLHGSPVTTGVTDVLADWLAHLDDRIPGPETHHRQAIRANLIKQLNRTSVRGNQRVFDLLIAQMLYDPSLPGRAGDAAGYAIAKIATRQDFERISALIDQLPPGVSRGALIEYMGKVKTDDARDIALSYLDTEWTYFSLKALISMRAAGVRERVEPYLDSPNAFVRKYARRAMKVLPE